MKLAFAAVSLSILSSISVTTLVGLGSPQPEQEDAQPRPLVGTVVAFAGKENDLYQDKWFICDGRPLKRQEYPRLFEAIGTSHGNGMNKEGLIVGDFNLPDYRGYFLRGVSHPDGQGTSPPLEHDPDSPKRLHMVTGELAGGVVGSVEYTATSKPTNLKIGGSDGIHRHVIVASKSNGSGGVTPLGMGDRYDPNDPELVRTRNDGAHGHASSGWDNESRPPNAYVNWIIKVK